MKYNSYKGMHYVFSLFFFCLLFKELYYSLVLKSINDSQDNQNQYTSVFVYIIHGLCQNIFKKSNFLSLSL